MKVIYMGTPIFAIDCLDMLLEEGHEVSLVITTPDMPRGRGHKMTPTPVKEFALEKGLKVIEPTTLKDNAILDVLEEIKPDAIIVVAYGKILPKYILEFCKYGCVNVHGSLLPKYRGAAPINWAIINGEKVSGITTMLMDEGIDTGDMLLKFPVEIDINDTAKELHDKLKKISRVALKNTLEMLEEGTIEPQKQNDLEATYSPMLNKKDGLIDWSINYKILYNKMRGLTPNVVPYCYYNNKLVKIYKVELGEETTDQEYGKVWGAFSDKGLGIVAGSGIIYIKEIQFENAKRMNIYDALRGNKIESGEYFLMERNQEDEK